MATAIPIEAAALSADIVRIAEVAMNGDPALMAAWLNGFLTARAMAAAPAPTAATPGTTT